MTFCAFKALFRLFDSVKLRCFNLHRTREPVLATHFSVKQIYVWAHTGLLDHQRYKQPWKIKNTRPNTFTDKRTQLFFCSRSSCMLRLSESCADGAFYCFLRWKSINSVLSYHYTNKKVLHFLLNVSWKVAKIILGQTFKERQTKQKNDFYK